MTKKITVRALIMQGGKLLCVRHKPYNGVIRGDYWCLPGGTLEDGEALLTALHREMIEETAVAPEVGKLLYIQQFRHNDNDVLDFFFHVKNSDDYLNVDLSKASHGVAEIEEIAFVDPKTTNILPTFLTTEDLDAKIAGNSPTGIFFQTK